jgi:hypothetical protein
MNKLNGEEIPLRRLINGLSKAMFCSCLERDMFFLERIQSIGPNDTVVEINPGGASHHRADVLLEKRFDDPSFAEAELDRFQ